MTLAGGVLAGGGSRRMGRDKALLEIDGEPLVLRQVARLSTISDPVIVASGDGSRLALPGVREVADVAPDLGPLGGIAAILRAVPHDLTAIVAVDLPDVSVELLARLAELVGGAPAAAPVAEGVVQPLHAVWHRRSLPLVMAALDAGERSPSRLLVQAGARLVGPDAWGATIDQQAFTRNLNRPGDLDQSAERP